jgi:hypothetical protein
VFSTQNDQQSSVSIVDLLTGTNLCDYKVGGVASSGSIGIIAGEYLIAAEKDRPKVNIWHLNKRNAFHKKIITPGVVNVLAVTTCSNYLLCAVGTKVCIWQVKSFINNRNHFLGSNSPDACNLFTVGQRQFDFDLGATLSRHFGAQVFRRWLLFRDRSRRRAVFDVVVAGRVSRLLESSAARTEQRSK